MPERTQQEFSKYLNEKFRVQANAQDSIELELGEVRGYERKANEQGGMERFSLFFVGPPDTRLGQGTYQLEHSTMGNLQTFLVPVGVDERGSVYEAVFNYFKL